jgi:hypothetical protein
MAASMAEAKAAAAAAAVSVSSGAAWGKSPTFSVVVLYEIVTSYVVPLTVRSVTLVGLVSALKTTAASARDGRHREHNTIARAIRYAV